MNRSSDSMVVIAWKMNGSRSGRVWLRAAGAPPKAHVLYSRFLTAFGNHYVTPRRPNTNGCARKHLHVTTIPQRRQTRSYIATLQSHFKMADGTVPMSPIQRSKLNATTQPSHLPFRNLRQHTRKQKPEPCIRTNTRLTRHAAPQS